MRVVQGGKEFAGNVAVIDVDTFLQLCLSSWAAQVAVDATGIRKLFTAYDMEAGTTVLHCDDFGSLLHACAPGLNDVLSDRSVLALYEEAFDIEYSAAGGGPAASPVAAAAVAAGEDADDALSPEAFALLCDRYGIVPYRKTTLALESGAGESHVAGGGGPAAAADDDDFAPVRRIGMRPRLAGAGQASVRRSIVGSMPGGGGGGAGGGSGGGGAGAGSGAATPETPSDGPTPRPHLALPSGGAAASVPSSGEAASSAPHT